MGLKGFIQTLGQADLVSSATPLHELGALALDNQGRKFRYVKAGAVNLVAGNCLQSPAWAVDQVNLACIITAIGSTTVTITNGATVAVTANQYSGGTLIIETTPGEGYTYRVLSNSAAATGGVITIIIEAPGLMVALTAASKASLHLSLYDGVIQSPVTTLTGMPVGVATYIITAAQYGWIGVFGKFGTLNTGTAPIGNAMALPGAAAGSATVNTNTGLLFVIGNIACVGVDVKVKCIFWRLG